MLDMANSAGVWYYETRDAALTLDRANSAGVWYYVTVHVR